MESNDEMQASIDDQVLLANLRVRRRILQQTIEIWNVMGRLDLVPLAQNELTQIEQNIAHLILSKYWPAGTL
jgi:hypothetical protein